ncbi:ATP-binding protein [Persephonella atlantica]|uniref:ATP-binding protein n=1 Tax=Persephonella atlantica TaxID=2699429 RepID=A0ABS1GF38_9AQUI|nr:ATP-binding protein [Persephonella atlantica]MBK3331544.1 ATP-binding protein [Persephonella atlantica]
MKVLKNILSNNRDRKILIMPVGISGSGKTTLYRQLSEHLDMEYVSFDQIRTEIYKKITGKENLKKEDYREIYRVVDDKKHKILKKAKEKVKNTNKNIIYIDNTNLRRKSRSKFLNLTPDFLKIGVFFIPNLKLCINRQFLSERDKYVPPKVILQQYEMLEQPFLTEFDIIVKKRVTDEKSCCHNRSIKGFRESSF